MSEIIQIRVIPIGDFPWPPHARTIEEAFDTMRQPPRRMTKAEFEKIYPSETT
jgi:hypothetical protein